MNNICIETENLTFAYAAEPVVRDVSFQMKKGEFIAIAGDNGSGKSTLLKLILRELKPQQGSISLFGKPIEQIKDFRMVGYVPQVNAVNRIAFPVTCTEMVVQNLYRRFGLIKMPKRQHKKEAREMLRQAGLGEYSDYSFKELSGGLQQRVMIVRAMMNDPELLILDEPTAGVDMDSKRAFLKHVYELNQEKGLSIVLVTHELSLVEEILKLDHIYHMEGGRLSHVSV